MRQVVGQVIPRLPRGTPRPVATLQLQDAHSHAATTGVNGILIGQ
jgi:hypothetical protein